ncbi:hypothetical protein AN964_19535 [Heyndrickxia shackletonii]|uniref:Uncharacterized protein n=1 Tax=Heyndrickxia shackletonii TaxID=157838 RepID=A0A0Q3WTF3_9BACI|nr:hypothetical protein AN964_19535 [Heyndrickxia shackletonii]
MTELFVVATELFLQTPELCLKLPELFISEAGFLPLRVIIRLRTSKFRYDKRESFRDKGIHYPRGLVFTCKKLYSSIKRALFINFVAFIYKNLGNSR